VADHCTVMILGLKIPLALQIAPQINKHKQLTWKEREAGREAGEQKVLEVPPSHLSSLCVFFQEHLMGAPSVCNSCDTGTPIISVS
jgi:hypothetical protein